MINENVQEIYFIQSFQAVAFHPNGKYLATGSVDQTIRLWCITSGKLLRVLTDCRLPVHKIVFSPNGKWLAAAGEESRVRIFDLASSAQIYELKDHLSAISDVIWSGDNQLIATATVNGVIRLYDIADLDGKTNSPIVEMKVGAAGTSSNAQSNGATTFLNQYGTHCKKLVKIKFNEDGSLSCVGSV